MSIEKFKKHFEEKPEQIIFYGVCVIVFFLVISAFVSTVMEPQKRYRIEYRCDWNGCRVLKSDRAEIANGCLQTDDILICSDYIIKEKN